jgi:hypothetical protein
MPYPVGTAYRQEVLMPNGTLPCTTDNPDAAIPNQPEVSTPVELTEPVFQPPPRSALG